MPYFADMANKFTLLLATVLLANPAFRAQPSTYNLRVIAQPGMKIGDQVLTKTTTIYRTVLNDAGEIVFFAHSDDLTGSSSIFTPRRIVARAGDVIDGKTIAFIPSELPLALNNHGQVAFEAWFINGRTEVGTEPWSDGTFVEKHLALLLTSNLNVPFTLTDDGRVLLGQDKPVPPVAAPTSRKKPGMLDRIRINTPKLPKGSPISIPATPRTPSASHLGGRPPLPDPLPLPTNRMGQMLILVNPPDEGFVLLLATPTAR